MIQVVFYQDSDGQYKGFKTKGHAGYADPGYDIICAAVSALVTNTVNSIELLTDNFVRIQTDEATGYMAVKLAGPATPKTELLLRSLRCGLESIEAEHKAYIHVGCKEV